MSVQSLILLNTLMYSGSSCTYPSILYSPDDSYATVKERGFCDVVVWSEADADGLDVPLQLEIVSKEAR